MMNKRKPIENTELVQATKTGDHSAFARLVSKYQQSAYSYACIMLRDFDLAHDAVQEAFLSAYYQLHKLKHPEAFPAWLNKIVKFACHRMIRRRDFRSNSGLQIFDDEKAQRTPDQLLEDKERDKFVLDTINALPDNLREVVFLFYMEERSQEEVARYLGLTKSTVNNRLHLARQKLRRRMFEMVKDTLKNKRLPDNFADNIAEIVRVQGSIIEARIKSDQQPLLFDQWVLADQSPPDGPRFTVIQRDVSGRIKLTSSKSHGSIRAGAKIMTTGEPPAAQPLDKFLSEIITTIPKPETETPKILESGIKMVDLMSPLPAQGIVGIMGTLGVGKAIFIKEMYHRLRAMDGRLLIFYFASQWEAISVKTLVDREPGFPADADGSLETLWLVTPEATDPESSLPENGFDTAIYFSPLMSCRNLYPAIDCFYSSSRLLKPGIASEDHLEVVRRIRELSSRARRIDHDPLFCEYVANGAYTRARERYRKESALKLDSLSSKDKIDLARYKKIEAFLSQPFFTAESYSGISGVTVPLKETIKGCTAILDGVVDDLPVEAFTFKGTLDDVMKEAEKS